MMRKLSLLSPTIFLVCVALVALGYTPGTAYADKYASIVINADTDEVLHARHADAERYPASLTKIMTLYMLFDALKSGEVSLNEKLPVSKFATWQAPSKLGLRVGETITVKDAINALVTKSANDVAVVVAERLGGSESRFAALMTVKAQSMGMSSTVFTNASGLPDSHQHSTARDLAIMSERLLEDHADYYSYFSATRFSWGNRTYKNHNALLGEVEGVDGIKTGYTRASGYNLIASARRNGHRIIVVMLGGNTSKTRNAHVEALIEAAYDAIEATPSMSAEGIGLRTRIAFQNIEDPLHPDAAARPMLNGKPFIAQGDADLAEDILATETPLETAYAAPPVAEPPMDAPLSAQAGQDTDTTPSSLDVASYEASQIVRPSADVAAYEASQFNSR